MKEREKKQPRRKESKAEQDRDVDLDPTLRGTLFLLVVVSLLLLIEASPLDILLVVIDLDDRAGHVLGAQLGQQSALECEKKAKGSET